ncbi:hypothetical protein O9992_30760 [Vibrio lentus]|nr:hypothetical protein [Vibrio lentus]
MIFMDLQYRSWMVSRRKLHVLIREFDKMYQLLRCRPMCLLMRNSERERLESRTSWDKPVIIDKMHLFDYEIHRARGFG